jgi:hypothetical protein
MAIPWPQTTTAIRVRPWFFAEDGVDQLVIKRESYDDLIANDLKYQK